MVLRTKTVVLYTLKTPSTSKKINDSRNVIFLARYGGVKQRSYALNYPIKKVVIGADALCYNHVNFLFPVCMRCPYCAVIGAHRSCESECDGLPGRKRIAAESVEARTNPAVWPPCGRTRCVAPPEPAQGRNVDCGWRTKACACKRRASPARQQPGAGGGVRETGRAFWQKSRFRARGFVFLAFVAKGKHRV